MKLKVGAVSALVSETTRIELPVKFPSEFSVSSTKYMGPPAAAPCMVAGARVEFVTPLGASMRLAAAGFEALMLSTSAWP